MSKYVFKGYVRGDNGYDVNIHKEAENYIFVKAMLKACVSKSTSILYMIKTPNVDGTASIAIYDRNGIEILRL